jgi:hypothetical protein
VRHLFLGQITKTGSAHSSRNNIGIFGKGRSEKAPTRRASRASCSAATWKAHARMRGAAALSPVFGVQSSNVIPISNPQIADHTVAIPIDHDLITRFRKDAAARETTVPRLINDLLATIADDRLVTAVLDDQPTSN